LPFLIEYIAEKKVTKIGLGDNFTIALGLTHPVVALKKLKMEFVKNKF
jgi:ABC-type enterochelin transport system permease subunit